jgi:hypothetical protein
MKWSTKAAINGLFSGLERSKHSTRRSKAKPTLADWLLTSEMMTRLGQYEACFVSWWRDAMESYWSKYFFVQSRLSNRQQDTPSVKLPRKLNCRTLKATAILAKKPQISIDRGPLIQLAVGFVTLLINQRLEHPSPLVSPARVSPSGSHRLISSKHLAIENRETKWKHPISANLE